MLARICGDDRGFGDCGDAVAGRMDASVSQICWPGASGNLFSRSFPGLTFFLVLGAVMLLGTDAHADIGVQDSDGRAWRVSALRDSRLLLVIASLAAADTVRWCECRHRSSTGSC